MNQSANEETASVQEYPLEGLFSYIAVLMQRAPGAISFRTGSGRIFRDLLLHWPVIDEWEDEAQEICQRIADAVFPLASALYAQAVEFNITISGGPILPPARIDAMASYIVFDADRRVERRIFLSPKSNVNNANLLEAYKGIVVLCRPLNYRYHTIKDDRGRGRGAGPDAFGYTEKLINQMMDAADFIPHEQKILTLVKAEVKALPQTIERAAVAKEANLSLETRHQQKTVPTLAAVTSLSALPPSVRALERRLFASITDKSLSAELRLGLRRIALNLRGHYPQVLLEEAARIETSTPILKPTLSATRPAAPQTRPAENELVVAPNRQTNFLPQTRTQPTAVLLPRSPPATTRDLNFSKIPLSVSPSVVVPRPMEQPVAHPSKAPEKPKASQPKPEPAQPQNGRQQAAQQPEPSVSRQQPAQKAAPQNEPSRSPATTQAEAKPAPRTTSPEQPKASQPKPEPAQPQEKSRRTTSQQPEPSLSREQPAQRAASQNRPNRSLEPQASFRQPEKGANLIPARSYDWDPEVRPKNYYASLKNSGIKTFPKAIPVATVGVLEKTVKLKQTQSMPTFQAALHKQRLMATLPKLGFEPFPSFFLP